MIDPFPHTKAALTGGYDREQCILYGKKQLKRSTESASPRDLRRADAILTLVAWRERAFSATAGLHDSARINRRRSTVKDVYKDLARKPDGLPPTAG
jgi:hypothetical protein